MKTKIYAVIASAVILSTIGTVVIAKNATANALENSFNNSSSAQVSTPASSSVQAVINQLTSCPNKTGNASAQPAPAAAVPTSSAQPANTTASAAPTATAAAANVNTTANTNSIGGVIGCKRTTCPTAAACINANVSCLNNSVLSNLCANYKLNCGNVIVIGGTGSCKNGAGTSVTPSAPATPSKPSTPSAPSTPAAPSKPSTPSTPAAPSTPATGTYADFQNQVVSLVNQQRAANGLKPLSVNAQLTNTATLKSQDMAKLGYFDHQSPTYGSPFDMMKKYGISYRTAGENIAMGQTSPEQVMQGWMNSPGHRANILNANYTQIGVGIAKNASGQLYWTQQFIG